MATKQTNQRPKPPLQIETFDDLVAALGGTNKCARLLGRTSAEVCQWRSRHGTFPSELFIKVSTVLAHRGYGGAPPHLFRFERAMAG